MTYFRSDHFNEGGSIELARQYGRYGYRKIAGLVRQAGWSVSDGRVERVWRREGLKVPQKQPKRGRLWLTDGSCIRLRPEHPNHVWSYDFIEDRTHEGRRFRMLNVIDEFTHECLAIRVARKLNAIEVIDVLSDLFILRGIPGHIRSDNGPEFVAKARAGLDCWCRCKDRLHRARQPLGKRLHRKLQCLSARRAAQWRDLLQLAGSANRHRELAASLCGVITMPFGRTPLWATDRQHRRSSFPRSPRVRLRYVDRLRRPRWRNSQH